MMSASSAAVHPLDGSSAGLARRRGDGCARRRSRRLAADVRHHDPRRGPRARRKALVAHAGDDDRDVARALADAGRPAAGAGTKRRSVGPSSAKQAITNSSSASCGVVVDGVGDGAGEHLANVGGDAALGELQHLVGAPDVEPADQVEHGAGLDADERTYLAVAFVPTALTGDGGAFVQLRTGHQRRPFVFLSCPAWNRKVRVGLNSPSL